MNDYPDIVKEVPAWAILPDEEKMDVYNIVHSERFKTGLAQFIRAVQRPLEERIAALERKMNTTGPWPADFPSSKKVLDRLIRAVVREMNRENPDPQPAPDLAY